MWESAVLPDAPFDPGEVCYVLASGRLWVSAGTRWLLVHQGYAASGDEDLGS